MDQDKAIMFASPPHFPPSVGWEDLQQERKQFSGSSGQNLAIKTTRQSQWRAARTGGGRPRVSKSYRHGCMLGWPRKSEVAYDNLGNEMDRREESRWGRRADLTMTPPGAEVDVDNEYTSNDEYTYINSE